MSRSVTTVRLDGDVNEWRQRECDNFSALVNTLVRQYMQGGQNEQVIREYRKRELEAERQSLEAQLQAKEELIEELEAAPSIDAENYQAELQDMSMVAPDPTNGPVKRVAKEYDKDAQTVAEDLAEMHNKEVSDSHDFDY